MERSRSRVGQKLAAGLRHRYVGAGLAGGAVFAVSLPLLDILGRFPTFLALRVESLWGLFAVVFGVILAPVLAVLVGLMVASSVGRRVGLLFEHIAVFGLTLLGGLRVMKALGPGGVVAGGGALGIALAAWWFWQRASIGRWAYSAFGVIVAVSLGSFFASPGGLGLSMRLARSQPAEFQPLRFSESADLPPVLFLVFDELSSHGLVTPDGSIDEAMFPHFGALSRQSLWFPWVSAASDATVAALPALLSGRHARPEALPLAADHPQNLFTDLGRRYRLFVSEVSTRLCPPELNRLSEGLVPRSDSSTRLGKSTRGPLSSTAVVGSAEGLVEDLFWVYLHLVTPEPWHLQLPPVDQGWRNFGGRGSAPAVAALTEDSAGPHGVASSGAEVRATVRSTTVNRADRAAEFKGLVNRASTLERGDLLFAHVLLPHVPWIYSPSGRFYEMGLGRTPGLGVKRWDLQQPALADAARQRYLAQLRWLDQQFGELLKRLKRDGLFDRMLIVVTSDHGSGFVPGEPRRNLTSGNAHELVPVPLWVKLPIPSEEGHGGNSDSGHRSGPFPGPQQAKRMDLAMAVDVLPTLYEILEVETTRAFDGVSLLQPVERESVQLYSLAGEHWHFAGELRSRASDGLELRDHPLLGQLARGLPQGAPSSLTIVAAEPDGGRMFEAASATAPLWWSAVIEGKPTSKDSLLLLTVNGVVSRVLRLGPLAGQQSVAALLPESRLREGANTVEVYELISQSPPRVARLLPPDEEGVRVLRLPPGRIVNLAADGQWFTVAPAKRSEGRVSGVEFVEGVAGNLSPQVSGWLYRQPLEVFLALGDRALHPLEIQYEPHSRKNARGVFSIEFSQATQEEVARLGVEVLVRLSGEETLRQLPSRMILEGDQLRSSNGRTFDTVKSLEGQASYALEAGFPGRQRAVTIRFEKLLAWSSPAEILVFSNGRVVGQRMIPETLTETALGKVRIGTTEKEPGSLRVILLGADRAVAEVPLGETSASVR